MKEERQDIKRITSEEIISWTIEFINIDLEQLDVVDSIKLKLDLGKYLLWYNALTGDIPEYDIKQIQKALRKTFETYFLPLLEGGKRDSPDFNKPPEILHYEIDIDGRIDKVEFVAWGKINWPHRAEIRFHQEFKSLLPLPANAFRKCEGCGRYFFSAGKGARSTRRFCTRKCNLQHTDKLRREKNPEAYKEKQRKIMKKRYADKKKKPQEA